MSKNMLWIVRFAAPGQEEQDGYHDRMGVLEMSPACTRSKEPDASPALRASAVMISTPPSPCLAANSAAMAVCAGSASRPTTRPAGATRPASRSKIPRGPQPRSIALCPGRRPDLLGNHAGQGHQAPYGISSASAASLTRILGIFEQVG